MSDLSIFTDESGSQNGRSRYCLVTLLLHDRADSISDPASSYEADLAEKRLPDIPFHASPLMNGHGDHEFMPLDQRKRLLSAFEGFVRNAPFSYKSFVYRRSEVGTPDLFISRLKKDRGCGGNPGPKSSMLPVSNPFGTAQGFGSPNRF